MIIRKKSIVVDRKTKFDSAYRPSALVQGMKCAGSFILKNLDKKPAGYAAQKGAELHEVAASLIKENLTKRKGKRLEETNSNVPDEDKKLIAQYVRNCCEKPFSVVGIEEFVTHTFFDFQVGGTPDFFRYTKGREGKKDRLEVFDLKTGQKATPYSQTYQLKFYCLGIYDLLRQPKSLKNFTTVLYTRYGLTVCEFTLKDLAEFKNHASTKLRGMKFNVGDHCADCYQFDRCAVAQLKAEETIRNLGSCTKKHIHKHYRYRKVIEKYFNTIDKKVVEKYQKTGRQKFGRFEVYETPGRRMWKRDKMRTILKLPGCTEVKPLGVKEVLDKGVNIDGLWESQKSIKVKFNLKKKGGSHAKEKR